MANERRRAAHISGWGRYVPTRVLTNEDLSRMVDTSEEWIRQRTGILERRVAGSGETTASMSLRAAQAALDVAGLDPRKVELIIVATVTPDYAFPSTACLVQDALGARRAGGFDLSAGCSGFVYGLSVAAGLIEAGQYDNAVVIGAETLSRITDWSDRNTCVLFGDGAGALVLQASGARGGVLGSVLRADGSGGHLLKLPAAEAFSPPPARRSTSVSTTSTWTGARCSVLPLASCPRPPGRWWSWSASRSRILRSLCPIRPTTASYRMPSRRSGSRPIGCSLTWPATATPRPRRCRWL